MPQALTQGNPMRNDSDRKEVSCRIGTAQDFGETEGEVPMRYSLEDFITKPLPEFHYSLLMARRAKMPALTGEGQEVFMSPVFALHTGKTVVEDAAIKIPGDDPFHISTEEAVLRSKSLVIDLLKFLKMILNALVI